MLVKEKEGLLDIKLTPKIAECRRNEDVAYLYFRRHHSLLLKSVYDRKSYLLLFERVVQDENMKVLPGRDTSYKRVLIQNHSSVLFPIGTYCFTSH